ncbi:MAG TPA: TonB-dependent receptor [Flavitalea sp.]|nr:TonB-dependent receptor [Flavitalea sp.]
MKQTILAMLCLCLTISVSAQRANERPDAALHDARGVITDQSDGSAIAAATIEVGHSAITTTDESGRFLLKKMRPGAYPVRISAIGYQSYSGTLLLPGDPLIVSLKRFDLFMEPVEVKAVRAAENAPFAKTEISKKEIRKSNLGQDLPFLLNQTPSVVVNSDAGNGIGYTGIRIRGSDATRINMTINGIPYNDAESQGLFFVNLPDLASSVDHIQVQRGIGASSYGAGAFGATINFSSNEVNTAPYAEVNNSAGSFNTWKHTVKAGTGLMNNHFTLDARLSKISSDGFIDRASTRLSSFYISGAYLAENTSLRMNILSGKEKTYQAWNGITADDLANNRTANYSGTEKPGEPYANETDNYQQDHYQLFFNHRFNKGLEFNTAFFLTRGRGYYEQYKAGESFADYGLPDVVAGSETITETDLVRQLWLDNHFYGQILSLQHKREKDMLTVGGGWSRYDGKHYGFVTWGETGIPVGYKWYDLKADKTDVNAYAKYSRNLSEALEVFADVQYRNISYNLYGFRNNPSLTILEKYNFLNPKAGLSYSAGDTRIYASYAYAAKEPNRDDFEAGAAEQPRPEKMHDLELGAQRGNTRWSWAANVFYMLYKDQLVPTGKINDVGAYTRTNIPNSYRAGIELQGRTRITEWMDALANASFSVNKLKDFTEYYDDYDNGGQKTNFYTSSFIAFSPAVVGSASLNIRPLKNGEINLIGKYVSRQYLDNTSNKERSLNPYYAQDARLSYTISQQFFKSVRLAVQVNNVFNKKYEPNGYTFSYLYGGSVVTENYYFPMAGTNFTAALNIEL